MSSVDDKFIRDFAFDPEFLFERTDSLKIHKANSLTNNKSKSINRRRNRSLFLRIQPHRRFEEIELDETATKPTENSSSLDDLYECEDRQNELSNEIEEFYYVSPESMPCAMVIMMMCFVVSTLWPCKYTEKKKTPSSKLPFTSHIFEWHL